MSGSSPLTRGKRSGLGGGADRAGIIPAHAGKTRLRASWAWRTWAHPRLRGENPIIVACRLPAAGSSPLTQGKPMPFIGNSHPKGIIPAHAGKTRRKPVQHDRHRDHPRSRGENTSVKPKSKIAWGSSPLTRGKRGGCNQAAVFVGLIPTHAGKTLRGRSPYQCPAAHPRSRGENPTLLITTPHVQGSSPLTRGKRRVHGVTERLVGLIPTHAGKTGSRSCRLRPSTAHPRSRGENVRAA